MDHKSFLERFAPGDAARDFNVSRICISHWKAEEYRLASGLSLKKSPRHKGWTMTAADLAKTATGRAGGKTEGKSR